MLAVAVHGEKFVRRLEYKGIALEMVSCPPTVWCGALGYALSCADEPDIAGLLERYQRLCDIPKLSLAAPAWSYCISIDYWQNGAAVRGLMFAQQVLDECQDPSHDVYRMPGSLYARAAATADTARAAFGKEECEVYELFGVIRDAMAAEGYAVNTNGAQEIELYDHAAGMSFAYVPVMQM